jgi:hypothetical protein
VRKLEWDLSCGSKMHPTPKETGNGGLQVWYLQEGCQHCQASWAPQGLPKLGECGAEVNHVDLERTRRSEWDHISSHTPLLLLRQLLTHLSREAVAINRVLGAWAIRTAPVQMQLQGPVLLSGAQGHR